MTDNEYEAKRNKLIPLAVKFADKTVGKKPQIIGMNVYENWVAKWNKVYFVEMERLAQVLFASDRGGNNG